MPGVATRLRQLAHLLGLSPLTGQLAISRDPSAAGWIPSSAHSRAILAAVQGLGRILYLRSWDELAGTWVAGIRPSLDYFIPRAARKK